MLWTGQLSKCDEEISDKFTSRVTPTCGAVLGCACFINADRYSHRITRLYLLSQWDHQAQHLRCGGSAGPQLEVTYRVQVLDAPEDLRIQDVSMLGVPLKPPPLFLKMNISIACLLITYEI